jgi:hypothetical protein
LIILVILFTINCTFYFLSHLVCNFRRSIRQLWSNSTRPEQQSDRNSTEPVNRIRLNLNSKRPDDDSVKETSPPSKFLGICTTIYGHDLFAIPINKITGAPSLSPSILPSSLCQSKLPSPALALPKNLMTGSSSRRRASDEAEGSCVGACRRR